MNISQKTIIFSLFSLFFFFGSKAYSQCGISGVEITDLECIENASYEFDLNFVVSQSNIDSFNVYINNNFNSRFAVEQLPVHIINSEFSGYEEDSIKVEDASNEECFEETTVLNPCGCSQFDFKYSLLNCTDTTYNIFMDFKHLHTADSFSVGIIHHPFGTNAYKDLPMEIGPFPAKDTTYLLFIADSKDFYCFLEVPVKGKDCPSCEIRNLQKIDYECNDNFQKNITFTIDYTNPVSDKYNIYINDKFYSTNDFKFQTLIDSVTIRDTFHIGPIDIDCDSTLSVRIEDNEDSSCSFTQDFHSLCCEKCELSELQFRDIACTSDSTFDFILDFTFANNTLDSFVLTSTGGINSRYSIYDLPLHFENFPITEQGFDNFTVCMDKGRCCSDKKLEFPDCDYFDCNIQNASYEIRFDTIESYWVTLNFDHQSTSDSFTIRGNGNNYGTFGYNELPVILGPYDCSDSLILEYAFTDKEVEDCKFVLVPGFVTCPPNDIQELNPLSQWNIKYQINSRTVVIYSLSSVFNNASIAIFNVNGAKINNFKLPSGMHSHKLKLPNLTSGIYLLRFSNDGKIKTLKIFVE